MVNQWAFMSSLLFSGLAGSSQLLGQVLLFKAVHRVDPGM